MSPKSQAELFTLLPIIVIGLVLFAMVKWGGARWWHIVVSVLAFVALSATVIGPPIRAVLSQIPYMH